MATLYLWLRQRTLLLLLTPSIWSHAPRLVDIERRDHEQHEQADTRMEQIPSKPAEVDAIRRSRYLCQCAHCWHM
jgi:hypothetical protein